VERIRQEVKMLDDLFKNTIVLIEGRYVKTPSDLPAATAAKALWAALKKDWWCDVRIVGLTSTRSFRAGSREEVAYGLCATRISMETRGTLGHWLTRCP
jgi:hypothetical protein